MVWRLSKWFRCVTTYCTEDRQLAVKLVCWGGGGGRGVSQESSHDCPQLAGAGWRTIPGLPSASHHQAHLRCPAPPPMPPLAAPPPWCTTAALRQPAAPAAVWCSHTTSFATALTFHLQVGKGAWLPLTAPCLPEGTVSANMRNRRCPPASNGGATLLPSASSWQCISNANFSSSKTSTRKEEEHRLDKPRGRRVCH